MCVSELYLLRLQGHGLRGSQTGGAVLWPACTLHSLLRPCLAKCLWASQVHLSKRGTGACIAWAHELAARSYGSACTFSPIFCALPQAAAMAPSQQRRAAAAASCALLILMTGAASAARIATEEMHGPARALQQLSE